MGEGKARPRDGSANAVLLGLGLGIACGLSFGEETARLGWVADAFIRLFRDDVLTPIEQGAGGSEGWARAAAAVERLRPLASEALLAGFQQVMTRAVEKALDERFKNFDLKPKSKRGGAEEAAFLSGAAVAIQAMFPNADPEKMSEAIPPLWIIFPLSGRSVVEEIRGRKDG